MDNSPPSAIKLHRKSALLELVYADMDSYQLSAEYLRVYSPSAEVRGHGRGQEVLQTGKLQVQLTHVESVGNYAIKLIFDDGHDSGIYSWPYLLELCQDQDVLWKKYLAKLKATGGRRDSLPADVQVINIMPSTPK